MTTSRKRRLAALLIDYVLILVWLGVLAAIFVPLSTTGSRWWEGFSIDGISFVTTVLPVWLYLTLTESRKHHATLGKRWIGLHVIAAGGASVGAGRIAVRNAVKLLPWQLAHLGLVPLWTAGAGSSLVPVAVAWYPIAATYVLIAVTVALAFFRKDQAALHDLIAGTRVVAGA